MDPYDITRYRCVIDSTSDRQIQTSVSDSLPLSVLIKIHVKFNYIVPNFIGLSVAFKFYFTRKLKVCFIVKTARLPDGITHVWLYKGKNSKAT